MNRSIVIFVALTVLVAHSLAIRTNIGGDLAPPYDQAFVAYRIARNLVFEGEWVWAPGQTGFDSYPSTLWVILCALAERITLSINMVVRAIGVMATATSFIMATRFHPDRAASLITPMLLAISGAMAAAAVNGTETALFTALVTTSFLAFESRRDKTLGVMLLLCGLTRGEGWILAVVFLLLRLRDRMRSKEDPDSGASLLPFLAPLAGFLGISALRVHLNGYVSPPWFADLIDLREGELDNGLAYVRDFFYSCASPALILYAVWYFLRRNLSRTGIRALIIFVAWTSLIIIQGGGNTPFSESMVPILPLTLIAGQEGLIIALNSWKAPVRALAWVSFLFAVTLSTLASFRPAEGGLTTLSVMQVDWMSARSEPRFGFEDELGRIGLDEEALATTMLRDIALFMRDQVGPQRTVLTPWPGSIAYLSSLPVTDLLGRATAVPPYSRTSFAPLQRRVDVLATLESAPDYIVPFWRSLANCPTTEEVAETWLAQLDMHVGEEGRAEAVKESLARYEVIAIPLRRDGNSAATDGHDRAFILRKRELAMSPRLLATLDKRELDVRIEHQGHHQLGDLSIRGLDAKGDVWYMNPLGRFAKGKAVLTRPNLLLTETGERSITLIATSLASAPSEIVELRIALLNPRAEGEGPSMRITDDVVLELPPE